MYKDYFRLNEMPFSIAPDPRFLFMSDRHREALAHLLYGVQGEGGIVLLTGEVGTGKTTICRSLLEQLPEHIDVAFILNPRMSVEELLETICDEYHIPVASQRQGIKVFVDAIHARLLDGNARGRRAILIVDEAQNLDPLVLEQLRLLTNLETSTRKLLQIILIGQPELQDLLARPEMRQVAQRVVARYHLTHLSAPEVHAYVAHRLRISGAPPGIVPDRLIKPLYRATGGVPRLINLVCDRALLGTYTQGRQEVSKPTLRQAIKEVVAASRPRRRLWLALGAAAAVLVGGALFPLLGSGAGGWSLPWAASPAPAVTPVSTPKADAVAPAEAAPPAAAPLSATAVASPAPVVSAAPPLAHLEWPASVARTESDTLAFQALFALYGQQMDGESRADACRQAESRGWRCYDGRGGISDLLLLDQPALLRLANAEGQPYAAVLTGLDKESANLSLAGVERRVPLVELADAWTGRFVILWKAPAGFGDGIKPQYRGPVVAWLQQALGRIDGQADGDAGVFGPALAKRVRSFQLGEGIQPDGMVGPLTAIRLNVRSGAGGPRISGDRRG